MRQEKEFGLQGIIDFTRNNTGIAHKNGATESSNNYLKNQIRQALATLGSDDFETKEEYEYFVAELVERRNLRIKPRLQRNLEACKR